MMKSRSIGGIVAALGLAMPATGQSVPEGTRRLAGGPATICGITASTAIEFRKLVEKAGLKKIDGGARFDVYMSPPPSRDMVQWAITREGEPAFPAATCRHVYKTGSGSWQQERKMRCDASRKACDALFMEFRDLDRRMAEEVARVQSTK